MTPGQYTALVTTMRRVEAKIDAVEARLAYVHPTAIEMREQLDAEINSILGCGVRVLADD